MSARLSGIDLTRAAWGIHEVINEDIARAFRMHAVERSFDCRRATIVAFGGGGPIHATGVARKLKAPRVVLPVGAGVMSALGLLASPLSFEVARTHRVDLASLDGAGFAAVMDRLAAEARGFLARAGVTDRDMRVDRRVDLRYRGQGYELEIALPDGAAAADAFAAIPDLFAALYKDVFRVDALDEPLEIVTWKVDARGPAPALPHAESGTGDGGDAPREGQPLRLRARARRLRRNPGLRSLPAPTRRMRVHPQALIEERESTCLLRAGDVAEVDAEFNLVVTIQS